MKLRGTKTEQDFRNELMRLKNLLYTDKSMSRFLNVLKENYPGMKSVLIMDWIPEQDEDIITFLVDTDTIVQIELDRFEIKAEPIISTNQVAETKKSLRKGSQIKLAVAIDLAEQVLKIK